MKPSLGTDFEAIAPVMGGGFAPYNSIGHFDVETQSELIDGIVPSYSCTYASKLRDAIEKETDWKKHLASKQSLFDDVNEVLGTAHEEDWNSWIDHAFDFLASRTCHGHPLPTNSTSSKSISEKKKKWVKENYYNSQNNNRKEWKKYDTEICQ